MQSLILMTGFNGEKYICEQIESICRQTLKDWHLLIRDDGSSDKTIDIPIYYNGSGILFPWKTVAFAYTEQFVHNTYKRTVPWHVECQ